VIIAARAFRTAALLALTAGCADLVRSQTSIGHGLNSALIEVAPGQLITLFVDREGAALEPPLQADSFPLPTRIAGFGAFANAFPNIVEPYPVYSVRLTDEAKVAVTTQVPFTFRRPHSIGVIRPESGNLCEPLYPRCEHAQAIRWVRSAAHVLSTCDAVFGDRSDCRQLVTRADGSLVDFDNRPQAGETLTAWMTGLGRPPELDDTAPFNELHDVIVFQRDCPTGFRQTPPADSQPAEFAALLQPSIGLYQVNFRVAAPDPKVDCRGPAGPAITIGRVIEGAVDSFDVVELPELAP